MYADGNGYSETPTGLNNPDQKMKQLARARHEAINGLFKNWGCLERRFRHRVKLHGQEFVAVANIVQALIVLENPIFQIDYSDN